jgi:hypothetical protein
MNRNNIDQALLALGDALKSQEPAINALQLISQFPDRSLTGNHIHGGKILNFESSGIKDSATTTKIVIENDKVSIDTLATKHIPNSIQVSGDVDVTGTIRVETLQVTNLLADLDIDQNKAIKYTGTIDGKGFLWAGPDYTRQLVYQNGSIFSSESINVGKDKSFQINDIKVLDATELGTSVVKSNLRQVGTLQGLIVDGSLSVNNYMIFDGSSDRLGLGTDEPNAAFSVAEDGIEVIFGTQDASRGVVGTFASHEFDVVTDNVARIRIGTDGNILLGNKQSSPIQVSVHGKLAVKVNMPDPDVDLHVNGAIKFKGKLQTYDIAAPTSGEFNKGDIVWNSEPAVSSYVGWICIKSGNPGVWEPFGKIGNQ